jgi:hypothetical protein
MGRRGRKQRMGIEDGHKFPGKYRKILRRIAILVSLTNSFKNVHYTTFPLLTFPHIYLNTLVYIEEVDQAHPKTINNPKI